MDIKTLESLGINPSELGERIVEQAVETLLSSKGFDPEGEREYTYESRFKKEIEKRIQDAVDAKIGALANEHLIPKVGAMIESLVFRSTNKYGEKKGEDMTFVEYIAARADAYMTEEVDRKGVTRTEGAYDWKPAGQRITVMMRNYIRETLEKHATSAVKDVNAVFATAIQNAAKDAITSAAAALKVSISA